MGVHVEWSVAREVSAELVAEGYNVGGDASVDPGHVGLVIDYGEVFVVEGTRDELRALLARLSAVVEGEVSPASESPYYEGDDEDEDDREMNAGDRWVYNSPQSTMALQDGTVVTIVRELDDDEHDGESGRMFMVDDAAGGRWIVYGTELTDRVG